MVPSLQEISATIVASSYPFQYIENSQKFIPEPVQKRIIFHAFPKTVKEVFIYCSSYSTEAEFNLGSYTIEDVVQVGFLLCARVGNTTRKAWEEKGGAGKLEEVRVGFDRCKITSSSCTCKHNKQVFYCDHVVALCVHRIRNAGEVELRVPISETLLTLSSPQLQKLIQYLLSTHPNTLPCAQKLADSLAQPSSSINQINGAPDLTAGAGLSDPCEWVFNEENLVQNLKDVIYDETRLDNILSGYFRKISLMTPNSDPNGPKILTKITQTFLTTNSLSRCFWDQLKSLWEVTVMNPKLDINQRVNNYKSLLEKLNSNPNMPLEDGEPLLKNCLELMKTDFNHKTSDLRLNCMKLRALQAHGLETSKLALKIAKAIKKQDNFELDLELGFHLYEILEQKDKNLAYEVGLLILGQERNVSHPEKLYKTEEKFLNTLKGEKGILQRVCSKFLSEKSYANSLPLYNFAKYLYKQSTCNVVFELCLKYLKMQSINSFYDQLQVNLALILISSVKADKAKLESILKAMTTSIKSVSSLFKIAQESSRLEESNNSLLNFSFNIGLSVLKSTLKTGHRRRWDIVRWVMNAGMNCGFYQVMYLLESWAEFFSPTEAVGTVATQFLSRGTSLRLGLGVTEIARLGEVCRGVALGGLRVDPGPVALNALTITEPDATSFETAYQIILTSAKSSAIPPQQIFAIARYMDHRGYPLRGYKLAAIAIGHLHIPFNQETHTSISDIHWTCNLAQTLGDPELCNLLPLLINNIKCASVLAEILKRAAMEPQRKVGRGQSGKIYTRLKLLVEATINAYISTIHNRLTHISPRHYSDFIEYLGKAKESFLYDPDGGRKWRGLLEGIKREYKGKKKLVGLVGSRFG